MSETCRCSAPGHTETTNKKIPAIRFVRRYPFYLISLGFWVNIAGDRFHAKKEIKQVEYPYAPQHDLPNFCLMHHCKSNTHKKCYRDHNTHLGTEAASVFAITKVPALANFC